VLELYLARGIIPGPTESEEKFLERAASLTSLPSDSTAHQRVKDLFGKAPDWVPIHISSKGLPFWEGAALWIEEEEGRRTCQIQIKKSLFYSQEEMLAHEMVHAMRILFDEPKFEEILAYQTSKSRFRRYFGPLFSSPCESKVFIWVLLLSWIGFIGAEFLDFSWGALFFALPFCVLSWSLFRLRKAQKIFAAAVQNLKKYTPQPLSILLCLTDQEIEQCATATFCASGMEQCLKKRGTWQ